MGRQSRAKRSRTVHIQRMAGGPVAEETSINGEVYYSTAKVIRVLGLTKDPNDPQDTSGGGKMFCHILSSYKLALHFAPYARDRYSYYVKKSDVDLARTLMDAGIAFMQDKEDVDIICVTDIPDGWCGDKANRQSDELFRKVFTF